ncbi:MAG TPA: phosphotransferase [Solirubrobacteraceae bacterium]|nr:phosphotransferase [Solirubrobacteraceae bacterium]
MNPFSPPADPGRTVGAPALAGLLTLPIAPATAARLQCAAGPAHLARAWPRRDGSLAFELRDAGGAVIAGQWRPDRDELRRIARRTGGGGPGGTAVVREGGQVLQLQARCDRRLPGLGVALDHPGAVLVGHRAEQRAVVRVGAMHIKVTRPQRAAPAASAARQAAALARAAGAPFAVALPANVDLAAGLLHMPSLPGASLAQRMARGGLRAAARAAGGAIAALHAADPPVAVSYHSAAQETAVLERWQDLLAPHAPALAERVRAHAPSVAEALLDVADPPVAPLHRDLHDGQILVDDAGAVGLLDLDTLAVGEPVLDVANLLVHLELAVLQGRCEPGRAAAAAAAFLDGYGDPPPPDRLAAYADAARLRLVCVHAFRPTPDGLLDALFDRLRTPTPGCEGPASLYSSAPSS